MRGLPHFGERPGIYIGRDAYGGAWLYDPWALHERSALAGPNMVVVCQVGFAKSSLIKTYLPTGAFDRVAWVIDPKSECRFAKRIHFVSASEEPKTSEAGMTLGFPVCLTSWSSQLGPSTPEQRS